MGKAVELGVHFGEAIWESEFEQSSELAAKVFGVLPTDMNFVFFAAQLHTISP